MLKKQRLYISALLISSTFCANANTKQSNEIKLSFIGDSESQAFLGVQQGIDEANTQGKFLGQVYSLTTSPSSSIAIFAAIDAKKISQLSKVYPNKVIFNLTEEDDYLRSYCFTNVLHTIPSQAMKDDAQKQWQKKKPSSTANVQSWHHTFKKYAAGQLNIRFTQSTDQKMTNTAWAGWAAVKLLSDSLARNKFTDTANLLKFFKTELAFDGQKGMSLNFRDTGQLRQPLLLVDNGNIVGEAPVRGVVNTTNLDSLGLSHCPK
jgi:hypothetical protein